MATPISIVSVSKHFPGAGIGGGRTVAVDQISLEVETAELFFLLGPSGCGKTTLLRMIAGFTEPTSGQILFGPRDVTHVPPNKRNTGMVFQSYALWPHMTVAANVAFGLTVRRVGAAERDRRVREALDAVRMGEYVDRKPNQLSGGQQQRVALARALAIRPDVLLLDEPLSNLDAKLRTELRSEIRRVCKEAGITSVYVTHDQKEALSMADRVAILDRGRVVQLGTPAELYRRPRSRFVAEFLGETNIIDGVVAGRETAAPPHLRDAVVVQTAAGPLVATAGAASRPAERSRVLCSIRPESLRLAESADTTNSLTGRLVETVYLGEIAQHLVELPGGTRVKVAEMNPRAWARQQGNGSGAVVLTADPEDVVLVPEGAALAI